MSNAVGNKITKQYTSKTSNKTECTSVLSMQHLKSAYKSTPTALDEVAVCNTIKTSVIGYIHFEDATHNAIFYCNVVKKNDTYCCGFQNKTYLQRIFTKSQLFLYTTKQGSVIYYTIFL